ncbi:Putative cyclase (fragment) [Nostocoides japonicum T1-X7]|uniref:Putative cyclase n=1 Tax=Nostocoides japonicum T1-X7 TaxID=1194083 RepID=A0A077LU57_9MICO
MSRAFRFVHEWRLVAPPRLVFDLLRDVEHYPTWWREIRRVERIDEASGIAWVRSLLPYRLRLVITREVEDLPTGMLRVGIRGDLEGYAEFRVPTPVDGPPRPLVLLYRQEVEVTPQGLQRLAPLLGPVLRANHAAMMRSGARGLEKACSGAQTRES